jgi:methyl-accepting chemotaxis protein
MNPTSTETPGHGGTDVLSSELELITAICERAAAGDMEARIFSKQADPRLKRLRVAINRLLDISDAYLRESAAMMSSCSQDRFHRPILLRGLRGGFRHGAETINAAGRVMRERSEQIDLVARLASENADNIVTVASAVEELNASSGSISQQTSAAARIAGDTASASSEAAQAVAPLGEAVARVNSIVDLINRVASQTNLLALNATIEAARAGEHGKGFAVVATEVKELSRSTAEATQEIRREVAQMQAIAGEVVQRIGEINESILQVDNSTQEIARAVEEQVKATAEISDSIATVSRNTSQVSERIGRRT